MSMMPTAMILDAGFASLPLQQAIKAAGFRTLACSGKAGCRDEICRCDLGAKLR